MRFSETCASRDYIFSFISFLSVSLGRARTYRNHFFRGFFCLQIFMNCGPVLMSFCLLTEVKWQWAMLVFGWVTLSRPAVGCVWVGIPLCHQTSVNSSALLVSLMACARPRGLKHLLALFFLSLDFHGICPYGEKSALPVCNSGTRYNHPDKRFLEVPQFCPSVHK